MGGSTKEKGESQALSPRGHFGAGVSLEDPLCRLCGMLIVVELSYMPNTRRERAIS